MAKITDRADRVVAKVFHKPSPIVSESEKNAAASVNRMVDQIKKQREEVTKGKF